MNFNRQPHQVGKDLGLVVAIVAGLVIFAVTTNL